MASSLDRVSQVNVMRRKRKRKDSAPEETFVS